VSKVQKKVQKEVRKKLEKKLLTKWVSKMGVQNGCPKSSKKKFKKKFEKKFEKKLLTRLKITYPRLRKKLAINCGIGLHMNNWTSLNLSAWQQRAHASNESNAWWNWTKTSLNLSGQQRAHAIWWPATVVQCGAVTAERAHTSNPVEIGRTAGQGCRASLPCKAAEQGCRARLLNAWWNWTIMTCQDRSARMAGMCNLVEIGRYWSK
jgi:hypothetical protein